jgi:ribosomal protein L12E/L44/L45/RPP1/RPP2
MADDIEGKLKKYVDTMQKQADYNGKTSGEYAKAMVRNAARVDSSLNKMVSNFEQVKHSTSILKGNMLNAAAWMGVLSTGIGAAAEVISDSIETYRDLNNVGQTFGGSMLNMQLAAAGAALPLKDFAELIIQGNNSMVAAAAGTAAFGNLGKTVRSNMKEFGMLGLTTKDFNEYLTEFSETQRLYGKAANLDTDNNRMALQKLTHETTMMSNLTGKNRKDIMKDTQQAMRTASVQVAMAKLSQSASESLLNSLQSSTTYLAGLPGEAGHALSNMLTETVGLGTSAVSEQIKDFNSVGLSAVGGMMDDLARKVKDGTATLGDQEQFRKQFVDLIGNNLDSLQAQLLGPNKEAASKAIKMFNEMKNIKEKTPEEIKKGEENESSTKFLLNIQERMNEFGAWIRVKFFKSFEKVYIAMENAIKSGAFKKLGDVISGLFDFIAGKIEKYLDPNNLDNFAASLESGVKTIGRFSEVIVDIAKAAVKVYTFFDTYLLSPLQKMLGDFGGVLASIGVLVAAKWLGGKMLDVAGGKLSDTFKSQSKESKTSKIELPDHEQSKPSNSTKPGAKGRFGKIGSMANNLKSMPKSLSIPGLAITAASLLGVMPKGFESIGNIASLSSMGAMIGSMVLPGVGTLVGGVIGGAIGLATNWKDAGKELGDIYAQSKASIAESYDKYISPMVGTIKAWWGDINFGSIADTVSNWFGSLKATMSNAMTAVSGKLDEYTKYAKDNNLTSVSGVIDYAKQGLTKMGIMNSTPSVNQLTTPTSSTPNINSDAIKKQLDDVTAKNQKLSEDNTRIKDQIAKLVDLLAKSNIDMSSYLKDISDNGKQQVKTTKTLAIPY